MSSDTHKQFTDHYNDTKDQVFNYFMVRLNFNRAVAEDLLMDVVVKAYENFHKFDEKRASFKTWIFTLAHNHLVNYWRDSKKTASLDAMEEGGFSPATVEIDDETEQNLENEKIQKVLSKMKEGEKEIVTLRYIQDLEYSEIAKVLGKKPGAIRTKLSRALKRFEEIYKKLYPVIIILVTIFTKWCIYLWDSY